MKKGILKITLKSDMCVGSGLSYAGIIDQDVVCDAYGFPYIPARRLKGCLREAMELFAESAVTDRLFGAADQALPGIVYLENAVLSDNEVFAEEVCRLKNIPCFGEHLRPEDILGLFTSVRAQTAIDERTGTAKENTLRMSRVVNQYNPLKKTSKKSGGRDSEQDSVSWRSEKEPLSFEAQVYYEEDETIDVCRFLKMAAKAVRHIGMNRNRGLGNVSCEFSEIEMYKSQSETPGLEDGRHDTQSETCSTRNNSSQPDEEYLSIAEVDHRKYLSYTLENTEPMVLSEMDKDDTASYISAKSVIGVLASTYLRKMQCKNMEEGEQKCAGNPADSDEFADLFLNGTVKYYNAYPAISEMRTFPAPLYLNRLKKTKKYVNILAKDKEKYVDMPQNKNPKNADSAYYMVPGNQPKKLKTAYAALTEGKNSKQKEMPEMIWATTEPERELTFHHRHAHGKNAPEEILYSQEVLSAGQKFTGKIEAPTQYRGLLEELLECADFRFGKSKNAQYGACRLISQKEETIKKVVYQKGDAIVVTLLSDGIFIREDEAGNASYTVRCDEVREQIAKQLGIQVAATMPENAKNMLQIVNVAGYNTKWNRKRETVNAVQAGSAFVYILEESWDGMTFDVENGERQRRPASFVGERNQEGYGEILVTAYNQMHFKVKTANEAKVTNGAFALKNKDQNSKIMRIEPLSNEMRVALSRILKDKMIRLLMEEEHMNDMTVSMSASEIGRITLMMKECVAEYENEDELAAELWRRIKSIKTERVREEALQMIPCIKAENGRIEIGEIEKKLSKKPGMELLLMQFEDSNSSTLEEKKVLEAEKNILLKQVWHEWVLQKLALMKYRKKVG